MRILDSTSSIIVVKNDSWTGLKIFLSSPVVIYEAEADNFQQTPQQAFHMAKHENPGQYK